MGRFRFNGIFWLASRPDCRVAGVLDFSRRLGGRLKLSGSFGTMEPSSGHSTIVGHAPHEEVRILGVTEKTSLTLEGCSFLSGATVFGSPERMPTSEYRVSVVLSGIQLNDGDPVLVKALRVQVCNLEDWIGASGVSQRIERDESTRGVRKFDLECTPIGSIAFEAADHSLELSYSYSFRETSPVKWALSERCSLSAMFHEHLTLEQSFESAGALSAPVSIGTGSASPITDFRVRVADDAADRDPNCGPWINVRTDSLAMRRKRGRRSIGPHEMLFSFGDIGGLEGVSRWLARDAQFVAVVDETIELSACA